jgi:hypothetical protein
VSNRGDMAAANLRNICLFDEIISRNRQKQLPLLFSKRFINLRLSKILCLVDHCCLISVQKIRKIILIREKTASFLSTKLLTKGETNLIVLYYLQS